MEPQTRRAVARARPELAELLSVLGVLGVENAAPDVLRAIVQGPAPYIERLAEDGAAWARFKVSFDSIVAGRGEVSPDSVTVGALAWVYLRGQSFTEAVLERVWELYPRAVA